MINKKFFSFLKKGPGQPNPRINIINNILFIHVPKTGGTSIAKTIGLNKFSHIKAEEILVEHNSKFLKNYFSFGVVRNPFDRFLSLFNYARMDVSYFHNNIIEPEDKSFPRHLDYELLKTATIKDCAEYLIKNKLKNDREWNQWEPQYTWLYDHAGKNKLVDKIYRLEDLSFLKEDLSKYGYKIESFPVLNSSKKQDYRNTIDSETRNILENIYAKDLEIFNYYF